MERDVPIIGKGGLDRREMEKPANFVVICHIFPSGRFREGRIHFVCFSVTPGIPFPGIIHSKKAWKKHDLFC